MPYLDRLGREVAGVTPFLEGVLRVSFDLQNVVAVRHVGDVDPLPLKQATVGVRPADADALVSMLGRSVAAGRVGPRIACSAVLGSYGNVDDAEASLRADGRAEVVASDEVIGESVRICCPELLDLANSVGVQRR